MALQAKKINGTHVISGYASTYDIDRGNDRVVPGAFANTIERHIKANRKVRAYFNHDSNKIIGGIDPRAMHEDHKGLFINMTLDLESTQGKDVYSLVQKGFLSDFSIGYSVKEFDIKNGIRELKEVELWEVSVVSEPMNPEAQILQKSLGKEYSVEDALALVTPYEVLFNQEVKKKQQRLLEQADLMVKLLKNKINR